MNDPKNFYTIVYRYKVHFDAMPGCASYMNMLSHLHLLSAFRKVQINCSSREKQTKCSVLFSSKSLQTSCCGETLAAASLCNAEWLTLVLLRCNTVFMMKEWGFQSLTETRINVLARICGWQHKQVLTLYGTQFPSSLNGTASSVIGESEQSFKPFRLQIRYSKLQFIASLTLQNHSIQMVCGILQ